MPTANILLQRVPGHLINTVTFTATGDGAIGTVTIGTVTGRILITHLSAYCSTSLTSGGAATIELGTANNTAALIAQTTGTDLDATEFWKDTSPEAEVSDAVVDKLVASNVILTVATATLTAGVVEFAFHWLPDSIDGNLA